MVKRKFGKYEKVSKCYVHDCLQNFLLLFRFLLKALFAKNTHILAAIYFIFLENVLDQPKKSFDTEFDLGEKICEVVIKEDPT